MHGIRFGVFLSTLLALIVPWSALAQGFPPSPPRWSADWGYVNLGPGWNPSLTLDDQGVPVVSLTQGLVNPAENRWGSRPVVFWNDGGWKWGGGWSSQNVDVVQDHLIGSPTSIAMRSGQAQIAFSGDNPMIAYTELDSRVVKFAQSKDGGLTWNYEIVGAFDSAPGASIAVSPVTGEPVIAITGRDFAANETRLHIARRNEKGQWKIEIVDSMDLSLGYLFAVNPRIAIDHDDRVHVAYEIYNYADEAFVRYAWTDPEPPTTTPPGN